MAIINNLQPDTHLHNRKYRILRLIESDSLGCTYEAENTYVDERVIIKEFFVKDLCYRDSETAQVTIVTESNKELLEHLKHKFLDEARALYKQRHTTHVFDIFEEKGAAYYVMRLHEEPVTKPSSPSFFSKIKFHNWYWWILALAVLIVIGLILLTRIELTSCDSNSNATDLSGSESANCYIVSSAGSYMFRTVQGNSSTSVGSVASAEVLWESFGTDIKPNVGDLIKSVSYKDGYIAFQTADNFKEGNAVIAAKAASGEILWSWHIWLTDQPQGQVYYNNAGTMMDRNLGATSATPGEVGALGLLYQWGRKDPFLGSSSISKSTITWPSAVESTSSTGTISYATAHPTTFITSDNSNYDWYYTGEYSTDNTRWTESSSAKSIYDPCPAGWRVPDGGDNGIWSKACGSTSEFFDHSLYGSTNEGMNFSRKFGADQTIWYPASGFRSGSRSGGAGSFSGVGGSGNYWSASPGYSRAYDLNFSSNGRVEPSNGFFRAYGFSVRCLQE